MNYTKILVGLFASIGMSFVMSLVMILLNTGWVEGFTLIWMKSWLTGFLFGFPAAMIVVPLAQKLSVKIVEQLFTP